MGRLFRSKAENKKGFWKRAVDLALTDVGVAVGGVDSESLESLEEQLLAADFGVAAALRMVDHVEALARRGKARDGRELRKALADEVRRILAPAREAYLSAAESGPTVYLIVGVNGVGKTTSIAKLAHRVIAEGKHVMLVGADTFRAGAVQQLSIWADRVGADLVCGQQGGDPAAVAFDAIDAAESRGMDLVLVDTAGRLHTQRDLMGELEKVDRVIRRRLEGAPHETLLVLDATVGQNAVAQARAFGEVVELSGIILAKLDSSARGGIVVGLQHEFGLSVKLVGTGEQVGDLDTFDPEDFIEGIFSE
ncbi:MAG: signal recognition particle-docking protein FtsY [Gemmatimonadota bacterium]|nr:MAG: signal recognition particle-docking protein FtsY [Gemmatimonadota bacterium]